MPTNYTVLRTDSSLLFVSDDSVGKWIISPSPAVAVGDTITVRYYNFDDDRITGVEVVVRVWDIDYGKNVRNRSMMVYVMPVED